MKSKVIKHIAEVYLEPIEHVYIHRISGETFKSVTTIIKLIENEFETELIAEAIEKQSDDVKDEKYIGLSKDEIINLWNDIRDEACEYGTRIHNLMEEYLLKNKWLFPKDPEEQEVLSAFEELNLNLGIKHYPEYCLYNKEYKVAGTTDLIVDVDDIFFDLYDYKTNKQFNFYSQYNVFLKKPFDYLMECHYNIYTLQLSIYAYMYEVETGKRCRSITILYWDRVNKKWIKIPTIYLKHEAIKLLKLYKMQSF